MTNRGPKTFTIGKRALPLCVAAMTGLFPVSAWAVCSSAPVGIVATPPSQILSKYPNGGGALVSEIRNLVATSTSGLSAVIDLAKTANTDQKRAIGAGLGQAAAVCARPEPVTARAIQEAILTLDSRDVSLAYQAATGDRETGAVSGGGGGAGGAGGGLGGGGTLGDSSTPNGTSPFFANSTTTVLNLIQTYNPGFSSVSLVENSSTGTSPITSVSQSR